MRTYTQTHSHPVLLFLCSSYAPTHLTEEAMAAATALLGNGADTLPRSHRVQALRAFLSLLLDDLDFDVSSRADTHTHTGTTHRTTEEHRNDRQQQLQSGKQQHEHNTQREQNNKHQAKEQHIADGADMPVDADARRLRALGMHLSQRRYANVGQQTANETFAAKHAEAGLCNDDTAFQAFLTTGGFYLHAIQSALGEIVWRLQEVRRTSAVARG